MIHVNWTTWKEIFPIYSTLLKIPQSEEAMILYPTSLPHDFFWRLYRSWLQIYVFVFSFLFSLLTQHKYNVIIFVEIVYTILLYHFYLTLKYNRKRTEDTRKCILEHVLIHELSYHLQRIHLFFKKTKFRVVVNFLFTEWIILVVLITL